MPTTSSSNSMSGRLIRGAMLIGMTRIFAALIGFASTILLARLLVPEDFGLVAIAATLVGILSVVSELSLGNALIQLDETDEEHYHTAFTFGVIRAVILGTLLVLLAGPISHFYDDIRLKNIIYVLACATLVGGIANPKMVDFARDLNFKPDMIIGFVGKLSGFIIAIVAAVLLKSYWALIFATVGTQIIQAILSYVLIGYRPRFSLSRKSDLLSFSVWITLGNWVQTLNWRADPLVLAYFIPVSVLGQYNMANRISQMAVNELTAPISYILFPAFSRIKDDANRLKAAYLKSVSILTSIAMPVSIGLAILAFPVVQIVLGQKWIEIVPYLQILSVTAALKSVQHVQPIAMATGNTKALFGRDVRALCIRVPLLFGGIWFGQVSGIGMLMGALIGRAISVFINTIWNITLIQQISRITLIDHLGSIWRPLAASLAMVVCVYLFGQTDFYDSTHQWTRLFISVSIGASVYMTLMVTTWHTSGRPDGTESTILSMVPRVLNLFNKNVQK